MIGSERLSQLYTPGVGEEFAEALALARDELGARRVRAHAIFHDDLSVYRFGEHDFSMVDAVYDRVLELGLKPVVELSFMPRELAEDPSATVFEYGAGISVPHDWEAWGALCGALAAHLVDRYGIDEVAQWGFEVWNEANLEVFWTGTREEYFRLYDLAAEAVKAVDGAAAGRRPRDRRRGLDPGLPRPRRAHRRAAGLPHHPHLREPAARRPRVAAGARARRRARGVVDRVGRHADALLRGQRHRVQRGLPAARHEVRAGARRRARLLGRLRPLRGARAPARRCCTAASG